MTSAIRSAIKRIARKPVIPPAVLTGRAVRVIATTLARNVGAFELSFQETVFGCLLLIVGGQIVWVQEEVDERLVGADAVGEHATVVTIVINAPFDVDGITG